jgi:hypothetical protein
MSTALSSNGIVRIVAARGLSLVSVGFQSVIAISFPALHHGPAEAVAKPPVYWRH